MTEPGLSLRTAPRLAKRQSRAVRSAPAAPLALRSTLELRPISVAEFDTGAPVPLQLAYALGGAAPSAPGTPLPIDMALAEPVFYGVRVNGEDRGVARLLRLPDGRWLARRADLEEWRLRAPDAAPVLYRGEEYFLIEAYGTVELEFNDARQEMSLVFPGKFFSGTTLEGLASRAERAAPPTPGGFANYDLSWNAAEESKRFGGVFEAGVFNRLGVGLTTFVASNDAPQANVVRLETSWTRDFPELMKTLTLGDTIGSSGIWGRPVRYGGIRYGTNFATNPGFISFPLPALRGEAALPTTAELYVNGILRQTSTLPPGPFQINNLPVITGRGDVRLVVRDLLGREQVMNLPYYTTSQLLRAGLTEESNELGFVREDFGLRSTDYGRAVLALQRRRGFSDAITGEARAEVLRDQQTIGGGGSAAFTAIGVFTGAGAASHGPRGNGGLLFTGFERSVARGINLGVRSQWTTDRFVQLGLQPDQHAPARLMSANVGYSPPGLGSIGVTYIRQDNRDFPSTEVVGATYSVSLARGSALVVTGFKPLTGEGSAAISVTLSIGFGERSSAFVSYTGQAHANETVAQVQQNLPPGTGLGYRLLAGTGANGTREELGVAAQTTFGTYTLEAGHTRDQTSYRAGATGAVAVLGGRPFLTRAVSDSFGVAHVPGFENVGVFVNNQLVGRTDRNGYVMLPRLLPYQVNPVQIDVTDLPLDSRIAATDAKAVPYYRSGLLLRFEVERANGALIVLHLENGEPLPVGSVVSLVGRAEEFPVAERGEVYVTGLAEKNRVRATWRNQSCEVDVNLGAALGTQPRIGPLTCRGVSK